MNKKELIKKIQQTRRRTIELEKKMFFPKKFLWRFHVEDLNDMLREEDEELYNTKGDYAQFKESVK